MSSPTQSLVKWFPPVKDKPSPEELALHTRLLFNTANDHDQAITTLKQQLDEAVATKSINTTTTITKEVLTTQFPGLGSYNDQTGVTAYTIQSSDNGILLIVNDASPVTVSLNPAITNPFFFFITNYGTAPATLLPTSPTLINGGASFDVVENFLCMVIFDGTNWRTSNPVGITGGGTIGFIPKFTATESVGDSHIDDGVTTAGKLTATEPFVDQLTSTSGSADLTLGIIEANLAYSPATDISGGPGWANAIYGQNDTNLDGQPTSAFSIQGIESEAINSSTTRAVDSVIGAYIGGNNNSTGSVTHLFGVQGVTNNQGGGHITNDEIAVLASNFVTGGSTTSTLYAFYADTPVVDSSTVGTCTGLFVPAPTISGGGTIATVFGVNITLNSTIAGVTTVWAIYCNGTASSFFGGTIKAKGGREEAYVAKTANYTLGALDYMVECTTNTFTITLPTAVGISGRVYVVKNTGTGTITINTTSSQTIDGSLTQTLAQWDSMQLISNGANWLIM